MLFCLTNKGSKEGNTHPHYRPDTRRSGHLTRCQIVKQLTLLVMLDFVTALLTSFGRMTLTWLVRVWLL